MLEFIYPSTSVKIGNGATIYKRVIEVLITMDGFHHIHVGNWNNFICDSCTYNKTNIMVTW